MHNSYMDEMQFEGRLENSAFADLTWMKCSEKGDCAEPGMHKPHVLASRQSAQCIVYQLQELIPRLSAGAMGSPGFVSPEVIMHEPHTPAMDVFSLGVVLFIMLVGRKPFNIKEIENLSYCNLDIHNAPGLQDSRCAQKGPRQIEVCRGRSSAYHGHLINDHRMAHIRSPKVE